MKTAPKSINCKGQLLNLEEPKIMGILNVTPDSFYAESRVNEEKKLLIRAEKMLNEGVDILDIGAYSSRPGADNISEEEETNRAIPAIESLSKHFPEAILSIDTFRSTVAQKGLEAGAAIINDISGGNLDERMFETVAKYQVPYILMHMKGSPENMQENPEYQDVTGDINLFFSKKIQALKNLGINDIILDPGFGFGKLIEHNYRLLNELSFIGFGDYPLLVGVSRKSMIYKTLEVSPEESLNGTSALHMAALERGAKLLRVHDVKEAKEVVDLFLKLKQ